MVPSHPYLFFIEQREKGKDVPLLDNTSPGVTLTNPRNEE